MIRKPQLVTSSGADSEDMAEAFEVLAAAAWSGDVVGALIGIVVRGRRYHVQIAGAMLRDPTFGRGVCAAIDDELAHMIHSRADSATTV